MSKYKCYTWVGRCRRGHRSIDKEEFVIIRFLKKIIARTKKKRARSKQLRNLQRSQSAQIIPRGKHNISHDNISQHALNVLRRLQQAGFDAYLVGGSVRDLLLGLKPKDFDIATNARPEKVRQLFRNCRLIGRRFRLAHVFFGREIIEVATFRTNHPEVEHPDARRSVAGMLTRDNVYGTMEDDAWRRDFSVNALYYNSSDFTVTDYTGGMEDLQKRVIRILGDPHERYKEDPVRILRAIRFAAKLDFSIESNTEKPVNTAKELLCHVSTARLFDEVLKLFYCGHAARAFELLRYYQLFDLLFSQTEATLQGESKQAQYNITFIINSCNNTDKRVHDKLGLNPAFLFAVLLWPPLQHKIQQYKLQGMKPSVAFDKAVNEIISQQTKSVAISKRVAIIIREIWSLQYTLQKQTIKSIQRVLAHARFRAAYDFLLLRAQSGETKLIDSVTKWTNLQTVTKPNIPRQIDTDMDENDE